MRSSFLWNRKHLRSLFSGIALYYLAENLWRTVLLWRVLTLTHSSIWMGVAVLADTAPTIVVGVLGPHRGFGKTLSSVVGMQAVAMALGALVISHNAAGLIILAVVNGWGGARVVPATQALLMRTTANHDLGRASATFELATRVGILAGPALGGVVLTALPMAWVLWSLTGLFLLTLVLWRRLMEQTFVAPSSSMRGFRDAVKLVARDAFLSTALTIRGLTNLLWPAFTLAVPLLVLHVWEQGAAGYGILRSLWGLGTIVSTLWMVPMFLRRLQKMYFVSWMVTGAGFLMMGLSPGFGMAIGADIFGALGGPLVHVALDTHIGVHVDPSLQGRIFAFQQLVMSLVSVIGLGLVSAALQVFHPWQVLSGAGFCIVIFAIAGLARWGRMQHLVGIPD